MRVARKFGAHGLTDLISEPNLPLARDQVSAVSPASKFGRTRKLAGFCLPQHERSLAGFVMFVLSESGSPTTRRVWWSERRVSPHRPQAKLIQLDFA